MLHGNYQYKATIKGRTFNMERTPSGTDYVRTPEGSLIRASSERTKLTKAEKKELKRKRRDFWK